MMETLKNNWLTVFLIIALVISVILAVTMPGDADLNGAYWECTKCAMPTGGCEFPVSLNYNCSWTCLNPPGNNTALNYSLVTQCEKSVLTKLGGNNK